MSDSLFGNVPAPRTYVGDYPGQFETPGDGGMVAPPGWVNPTTPGSATVQCGNITQTATYTTAATEPVAIGFDSPATWSQNNFLPDLSGVEWTCQTTGIYNLRFNQTVDVTNVSTPADSAISVIPNTTFYLDVSGDLVAPQIGTMPLHNGVVPQSSITATEGGVVSDVLMATFVTAPNFLTNTVIPGGIWNLSLWASSDDVTESNYAYMNVYTVDADGSSNPVLVYDGTGSAFIVSGATPYNYNVLQIVPTFEVADLTKRLAVVLYANFGVASSMSFYFRNAYVSNITTTVTQDIVPLTADTVDLRMTVTSATTEFNQVFATSIPISIGTALAKTYSASVNALANVVAGDTLVCSIVAVDGNVVVSSGQTTLPSPANTLQWNLIAQGAYGNIGVIV